MQKRDYSPLNGNWCTLHELVIVLCAAVGFTDDEHVLQLHYDIGRQLVLRSARRDDPAGGHPGATRP
ncbi:MAG: hypothetical protein ACLP0J_03870 [Solirubrobacteraceae bacterium]